MYISAHEMEGASGFFLLAQSLVSNEKIQYTYEITSKYTVGTLSLFLMSHLRKHETKN